MQVAMEDLDLDSIDVIYPGDRAYTLGERIRAVPLRRLLDEVAPFSR